MGTSPAAAMTNVGFAGLVVARPVPDANTGGAVLDRLVDVQPLRLRLFAGDDDVDEVARAQAPIGNIEQRVGVRREKNTDDVAFLVHHKIDEAWVLMGKTVVVLAPDMGGKKDVQRSDGAAPGDFFGDAELLSPLSTRWLGSIATLR